MSDKRCKHGVSERFACTACATEPMMNAFVEVSQPDPHPDLEREARIIDRCARGVASLQEGEELRALFADAEQRIEELREALRVIEIAANDRSGIPDALFDELARIARDALDKSAERER